MNPDRFDRIKRMVLALEALPEAERAAWLERECAGEPTLSAEVATLMRGDVPSIMRTGGIAERVSTFAGHEPAGAVIGPYRLTGVLGEGGMGVVYRAEQEQPIRREVALKLLPAGLNSTRAVARFEAERQTLARLSHPYIAQVFDAGAGTDGRQYFAMELVAGEPITVYCAREQPPLDDRLRLFLKICDAVQHAHQRGIIHRDLKPSNVLVTSQGVEIVPKVIDFGIAKAIDDTDALRPLMTQAGQLIGTPEYMSPEQAGVIDAVPDTRSDVYALGVMLYELVSGRRPYDLVKRTPLELDRALRTPPVPPSRVVRAGQGSSSTARDIDAVVLMAMECQPDDRYASVGQFADDVRRAIEHRPVRARTQTWRYRTGKFVRRHAAAVAATAAAIILALAAAAAIVSERNRAVAQAAAAKVEADRANAVSQFLINLFEANDPANSLGASATARDLLTRGEQRLATDLGSQDAVRATLMDVIGVVYQQLGLINESERITRDALAVRRKLYGPIDADVATTLDNLGQLMRQRTRYDEAVAMHREAADIRRQLFGHDSAEAAASLNNLGLALRQWGRLAEAEPILKEALDTRIAKLGPEHTSTIVTMSNYGDVLDAQARYDEAERWYRRVLEVRRRTLDPNHPRMALILAKMGKLLLTEGRFREAEGMARQVLAIREKTLAPAHPDVALSRTDLAQVLIEVGGIDEAEALLRDALANNRALYGERHMEVATCLAGLGAVFEARGRYADALQHFEQARALRVALQGEVHESVADALIGIGRVQLAIGALPAAERSLRRALAIRQDLGMTRVPRYAMNAVWLGRVEERQGRFAPAKASYEAALAGIRDVLPAGSPVTAAALTSLGHLLSRQQQTASAEAMLREALAFRRQNRPPGHRTIAESEAALGEALLHLGKLDEAERLLRSALAGLPAEPAALLYDRPSVGKLLSNFQPRRVAAVPFDPHAGHGVLAIGRRCGCSIS
jgi:tetratricopeptide (TPR) repeat protein